MAEQGEKQLIVVVTKGTDYELSSFSFTIANGGPTAGLDVSIVRTSGGVAKTIKILGLNSGAALDYRSSQ